jgi:hypothetical protein
MVTWPEYGSLTIPSHILLAKFARTSRDYSVYTPLAVDSRARNVYAFNHCSTKYGCFVERGRCDRQHAKRSSWSSLTSGTGINEISIKVHYFSKMLVLSGLFNTIIFGATCTKIICVSITYLYNGTSVMGPPTGLGSSGPVTEVVPLL